MPAGSKSGRKEPRGEAAAVQKNPAGRVQKNCGGGGKGKAASSAAFREASEAGPFTMLTADAYVYISMGN